MNSSRGEGRGVTQGVDGGVVRGCSIDATELRPRLRALPKHRGAGADATTTHLARGETACLVADGEERFGSIQSQANGLFSRLDGTAALSRGARPRLYGGFAFTDSQRQRAPGDTWDGYPSARFVLPEIQCTVTADGTWLTTTATGPGAAHVADERVERWRGRIETLPYLSAGTSPGVIDREFTPSRREWYDGVKRATERIETESLRKVVLAQSLKLRLNGGLSVPDTLARLGAAYPGCYRFLFEPEDIGAFFGATPERLVTVRDSVVDTEALAGSIGRGETTEEDRWLANQLRDSEKDAHEHQLVVDAVREQLEPLAADIELGERMVRKLANVQHLRTPIRATLAGHTHVLSLVEALHPTPAVGGRPPETALQTIAETEAFDRGWYAAPVGWFDADGDGTFAVAIRSAVASGSEATLFAGAGIVGDSDPDEEWEELQLKYRPIFDELV